MEELKQKIIDKALLVTCVFASIPYLIGLIRVFDTGLYYQAIFYSILFLFLIVLSFFKSKIKISIKVHSLALVFSALTIFQVYHISLIGAFWGLMPLMIYSLVGFKKSSITYFLAFGIYLYFIGIGSVQGFIIPVRDLNHLLLEPTGMISSITSIMFIVYLIYVSAGKLFEYYANANSELLESESRLKYQIKKTPVPIVISSNEGELIDYNEDAEKLFEVEGQNLKGFLAQNQYRNPEDRKVFLAHFQQKGFVKDFEVEILSLKGNKKIVSISAIPFEDKEKGIVLLTVFQDITDRRKYEDQLELYRQNLESLVQKRTQQLEESNARIQNINKEISEKNLQLEHTLLRLQETQTQLIQQEKMASLGTLLAGVAHEINNPLNFIMGASTGLTEYFNEFGSENPKRTDLFLKSIQTGLERVTAIVKGLNLFSRNNESMGETCDLHAILDNSFLVLHSKFEDRINLEKNYTKEPLLINGNVGMLHQVFTNLINNSIYAIGGGKGLISIETAINHNQAEITIKDTGSGMSKEVLKKITDPFFTTKPPGEGTGLGLSITYSIIQKHQGMISFESEIGEGTKVSILLPLKS